MTKLNLSLEVDLILRRKLSNEEYLITMSAIEGLVNQHRQPQDSTHFLEMVDHFRTVSTIND